MKEMSYTIVEPFSTDDGDSWSGYCAWRGISFESFDSVDGILRPKLFCCPESDGDWTHVKGDAGMFHLITDFTFARKKLEEIGRGIIVGLHLDAHDETHPDFLGFDLIDGFHDISLLTNWGNEVTMINEELSSNGLVRERAVVKAIKEHLTINYAEDPHVEGCRIVSVYRAPGNAESAR